jgi:hypothetical protein
MAQVSLRKVVKAYDGGVQAVKGIDLEIATTSSSCSSALPAAASPPRCG